MDKKYVYQAEIVRVIDGDTVDAVVDLGFDIKYNVRLRLRGIDTMEIRDHDPEKRAHGLKARQRMIELVEGKIVVIESHKTDKYGRYLADIYLNETNINQQLITEGLAVPYMT